MQSLILVGLLLQAVALSLSQDVLTISPQTNPVILPDDMLRPSQLLICFLTPASLTPNDYESRWITPMGTIVTKLSDITGRYAVTEGGVPIDGVLYPSTLIVVQSLSYQDAGTYTCEARNANSTDSNDWISANIELQLNLELATTATLVMASTNDSFVELFCEMSQFIRPDGSLTWAGPDGQTINSGTNRHQITFSNGTDNEAVDGSLTLVPSRVSTLRITNPISSDSGNYTCSVTNTNQAVTISLTVTGSDPITTTSSGLPTLGTQMDNALLESNNTTDESNEESNGLPLALILSCSLVGTSFLIVLIMIIFVIATCVSRRKSYVVSKKAKSNSSQQTRHYDPSTAEENEEESSESRPRPVYAQVHKPHSDASSQGSPVRLVHSPPTEESVVSNGTGVQGLSTEHPQPWEILAFSGVPRHGFRPFPPPPHVATWLNQSDLGQSFQWDSSSYHQGHLDSYDGTSDISSVVSSLRPSDKYNWQNSWHPSDSYYDRPAVLHEDATSSVTSSMLQVPRQAASSQISLPEGHYQVPNSRPATLSRTEENSKSIYDHIYSEQLEPSMFQALTASVDQSTQALPYAPIYASPRTLRKSEKPLEISRQNIVEIRDLGVGHFGRVVLAATTKLSLSDLRLGDSSDRNCSILVAIKKLNEEADTSLKEAFHTEVKFMSKMKHANVVRLLGVCTSGATDEPFMMMEYMENGDLHEFLQKQVLVADTVDKLGENHITPLILLYMSVQVANGMRYLASKKFVHRDLATRNCLVGRDFVVKISDFGMSRNLYESVYYRVQGRLILPIRWMAYESFYGKFSVKSDAWAFGVTIWEIYTLCQLEPYTEMSDEEYINDAVKGAERTVLSQPEDCPDDVYEVMKRCFVHEPMMRADFEEIYSRLFLTYTKLGKLERK